MPAAITKFRWFLLGLLIYLHSHTTLATIILDTCWKVRDTASVTFFSTSDGCFKYSLNNRAKLSCRQRDLNFFYDWGIKNVLINIIADLRSTNSRHDDHFLRAVTNHYFLLLSVSQSFFLCAVNFIAAKRLLTTSMHSDLRISHRSRYGIGGRYSLLSLHCWSHKLGILWTLISVPQLLSLLFCLLLYLLSYCYKLRQILFHSRVCSCYIINLLATEFLSVFNSGLLV